MKILLVGGLSVDNEDVEALKEWSDYVCETAGSEAEVLSTHLDLIAYTVSPDKFEAYDYRNKLDLAAVSKVIIRGPKIRIISEYVYYLSRYCSDNGVRFWNDYSQYYPGTKVAQAIVFREQQVPFLATTFAASTTTLLDQAESRLGYPYILKSNVGSHGDSNYLINSRDEAQRIVDAEPEVKFLAQAYCPNDRDYRVLLIEGRHLVFERRGTADTHINNTSKGGEATLAHDVLPAEVLGDCQKLADRLGLTVAGIDVMPHLDSGQYFFLEVNSQPQLRTGAFLDEKRSLLKPALT